MIAQNTPNAKDCCSHSFWTQTLRKLEKYEWGSQGFQVGSHYEAKGLGENTTHPSPVSISLRPEGPGSSPETALNKGKCKTKAYESLCCVAWRPGAQRCHQPRISRCTGKERKFNQRAALLLWPSYFLNESSFWLISLRVWELSCPSTHKKMGELGQLCICTKWERRGRDEAPTWWSGEQLEK